LGAFEVVWKSEGVRGREGDEVKKLNDKRIEIGNFED